MKGWKNDKKWSDKFLPEIKAILGQQFIGAAPYEEDTERNTDLIVLKLEPIRIACRLRRKEYFEKWPDEFTIRSSRPTGNKTELTKIMEGWGDYFFYGFCDDEVLVYWTIGDLKVFRLWFNRQLFRNKGAVPGKEQKNGDGSSLFIAFRWSQLPPEFIVNQAIHPELSRHEWPGLT